MGFFARFFRNLREPSTWGAVSALAIGVGASQEDVAGAANGVALSAALIGILLPDASKSE